MASDIPHTTIDDSSNQRTSNLAQPYPTADAKLDRRYRALGARSTRPFGWYTGSMLFSAGIGIMVYALLFDLSDYLPLSPLVSVASAVVLGIVAAVGADDIVRLHYIMPRGICFLAHRANPYSPLSWVLPLACFLALAVLGMLQASASGLLLAMSCLIALVPLVSFKRCGEGGFLVCSIALFVAPTLCSMVGFYDQTSLSTLAGEVLLTESIIVTVFGIERARSLYARSEDDIDFDRLDACLHSDDPAQRLLACVFCTGFIDPKLMGPLLERTRDEDRAVAYAAQTAFSNMWGPNTEELMNASVGFGRSARSEGDLPDDLQQILDDERADLLDVKMMHQEEVESEARQLPKDQEKGYACLCALATDEHPLVPQARIVALEVLGCVRSPRAYAIALSTLLSDDPQVERAAETAFYGADPSAVIYLEQLFANGKAAIRRNAIRAACQLIAFWNDRDSARSETIHLLLEPSVDKLLSDPDTEIRALSLSLLPLSQPRTLAYLRSLRTSEPESSPVKQEADRLLEHGSRSERHTTAHTPDSARRQP